MTKQLVGLLALGLGLSVAAVAQPTAIAPTTTEVTRLRSSVELEKLVAPIALYPDSLVAIILPAATESADLVMAVRFLGSGGDAAAIDSQSWDGSVKSLARYPDVLRWMDANLEWTRDLGDAFLAQPNDVMNAVQRLRLSARGSGVLQDTPEQRVLVEADEVRIVPTSTQYIYIPYYDPDILFVRHWTARPLITFSAGLAIGHWLHYDCDWRARSIWVHHLHPGWVYTPGWRPRPHAVVVGRPAPIVWAPRPVHVHRASVRPPRPVHHEVVYPRPMPHAVAVVPGGRPEMRAEPARPERQHGPVPQARPRLGQPPTPPPPVAGPPAQPSSSPRPVDWRQRPVGQAPSHGYPTGPAPRDQQGPRAEEPTRRHSPPPAAPAPAPAKPRDNSASGNTNSTSAEENKATRPGDSGRGTHQRNQP